MLRLRRGRESAQRTPAGSEADRRLQVAFRLVCHVAAELPLLIIGIQDLAHGWLPLSDNAATAWRSYLVFTPHTPLVGHEIVGFLPYGPGPLQNWLLAVPVRLNPAQGPLWGSVLFGIVAVALGVEAGWSVARRAGALAVALGMLVLFITQWQVLVDPVWNASFGAIWFLASLATGWASASGRLRWWPATVLAASITAQCHELPLLSVMCVALVSGVVGAFREWRTVGRASSKWLLVGAAVGIAVWIPPIVQQLTHHPGNFTLLWRASHSHVATYGIAKGFGELGAMTRPIPFWLHKVPGTSLANVNFVFDYLAGPEWWGVTVVVLLGGVAVASWLAERATLAALSTVSFVASLTMVLVLAAYPESQWISLVYLEMFIAPVGMAAWLTLLWSMIEVVRRLLAATRIRSVERARPVLVSASLIGAGGVLAASGLAVSNAMPLVSTWVPTLGEPWTVHVTRAATTQILRRPPGKSFVLHVLTPQPAQSVAIADGVGYLLRSDGFRPRLSGGRAQAAIGDDALPRPGLPIVTVDVPRVNNADEAARPRVWVSRRHVQRYRREKDRATSRSR